MKFKKGLLSLLILFSYQTFFLFSAPEGVDVDVIELHSDDSWPVIRTECQGCGAEGEEH